MPRGRIVFQRRQRDDVRARSTVDVLRGGRLMAMCQDQGAPCASDMRACCTRRGDCTPLGRECCASRQTMGPGSQVACGTLPARGVEDVFICSMPSLGMPSSECPANKACTMTPCGTMGSQTLFKCAQ